VDGAPPAAQLARLRSRGRRASTLRDSARLAFDHEVEVLVARAKWAEREAKRLKR